MALAQVEKNKELRESIGNSIYIRLSAFFAMDTALRGNETFEKKIEAFIKTFHEFYAILIKHPLPLISEKPFIKSIRNVRFFSCINLNQNQEELNNEVLDDFIDKLYSIIPDVIPALLSCVQTTEHKQENK